MINGMAFFFHYVFMHSCRLQTLILSAGAIVLKVDASWLLGCQVFPKKTGLSYIWQLKTSPTINWYETQFVPYFGHSCEFLPTCVQHSAHPSESKKIYQDWKCPGADNLSNICDTSSQEAMWNFLFCETQELWNHVSLVYLVHFFAKLGVDA